MKKRKQNKPSEIDKKKERREKNTNNENKTQFLFPSAYLPKLLSFQFFPGSKTMPGHIARVHTHAERETVKFLTRFGHINLDYDFCYTILMNE